MATRKIAILGSTGSIGTQTLDVIAANPDKFEAYALTANNNIDLFIEQCRRFKPSMAIIANDAHYERLKDALSDTDTKVFAGMESICDMVEMPSIDIVLTAMVGYAGLQPTIRAIKAHKDIALANKETLVVAGELICDLVNSNKVAILPVDSEHSAIFQCLAGNSHTSVEKLILTASGGPFRTKNLEEIAHMTKADALKHPNWSMGAKITIDSASMMNKGFEVIEAKWLFGMEAKDIEVVVHPQSIIHSMVQFRDGAVMAQLGMPDMRVPIQYALTYPSRIQSDFPRIDFSKLSTLTFEQPDTRRFRNLQFAFDALQVGGNRACVLNAANEVVVDAFLHDRIGFLQMSDVIEQTMAKAQFVSKPSYSDYVESDMEARRIAAALIR